MNKIDLQSPPQGKRTYHFKVDGHNYSTKNQFVTGLEIRQAAGLPADAELYQDLSKDWQDHYVSNDDRFDLAMPGIEKFISLRDKYVIFVNGTPHEYSEPKVTYEKIIELAHVPAHGDNSTYIVKYSGGPEQNPHGMLVTGQEVYVKNRMDFNVRSAHQS